MNNYELLYIIDKDVQDEAREALIAKLNGVITDDGGNVESVEKWGMKKLAYPINFKNEGFYVLVNFSSAADIIAELERVMRITDGVIRFMVVKK